MTRLRIETHGECTLKDQPQPVRDVMLGPTVHLSCRAAGSVTMVTNVQL